MRRLIARRQGRQLDRDAVADLRPLPLGGLADGGDRVGVDLLIALGVGGGAGALAQHVEAAQPALAVRPLQRRLDGAADHELLAHDAHGGGHGLADHRLAQPPGDAVQEARQVGLGLFVDVDQLAGQHQPPGRGVDEQAVGLAQVDWPSRPSRSSRRSAGRACPRPACAAGPRPGTSGPDPRGCPSENSCRKLSTTPCFFWLLRACSTRSTASSTTACALAPRPAAMRASRARTVAGSSANLPWSSVSQSWDRATGGETCAFMAAHYTLPRRNGRGPRHLAFLETTS